MVGNQSNQREKGMNVRRQRERLRAYIHIHVYTCIYVYVHTDDTPSKRNSTQLYRWKLIKQA